MKDENKSKIQIINELSELRNKVAELESKIEIQNKTDYSLKRVQYISKKNVTNLNLPLFFVSIKGIFIDISSKYLEQIGYEENFIIGKSLLSFIHPDEQSKIQVFFEQSSTNNNNLRFRFKTNNGSWKWFKCDLLLEHDNDGNPFYVGVCWELNKHPSSQNDKYQDQYFFNVLMDYLPDAVYFKDRDSRFIKINRAMAKKIGINNTNDAIGKTDFDFFTNRHARSAFNDEKEIIQKQEILKNKIEKEIRPDGKEIWVSTTKAPFFNEDNETVGTFGISRDITERIKSKETLNEYESRLKLTLDTANSVSWNINLKTLDVWIDDKFLSILGYDRRYVQSGLSQSLHHPDDWRQMLINLKAHIDGKSSGFCTEHRLLTRAGKWKWFQVRGKIVEWDKNGSPVRIIGTALDISERKKTAQIQKVLLNITQAIISTQSLKELLEVIHQQLGCLIDTTNFYVALYDKIKKTYSFPFYVDEFDKLDNYSDKPLKKSITDFVRRTGLPLLAEEGKIKVLCKNKEIMNYGTDCLVWLGVPLKTVNGIIGVAAVQSYKEKNFTQKKIWSC